VLVSQLVPYFFFVPVAGVLADRMNRQALMVGADVVRAVLCLGFFLVGPGTVWVLFVLQAALAIFTAVFEPAASAAVPNLVDEDDLSVANSLVGSAWGTMLAIGAALGGLIAAAFGKDAAFIGDAGRRRAGRPVRRATHRRAERRGTLPGHRPRPVPVRDLLRGVSVHAVAAAGGSVGCRGARRRRGAVDPFDVRNPAIRAGSDSG